MTERKRADDEPTRHAKDDPPPPHRCPYGGEHWTESAWVRRRQLCGEQGWLCDRCKEDRADARSGMDQAPLSDRMAWVEDHLTAIETKTLGDLFAQLIGLSQTLADTQMKVARIESRLPGPQTRTQDLGTFDAQTGQRVDEPTQHGEARTCGNCARTGDVPIGADMLGRAACWAPLPMWADDGDRPLVGLAADATHCAAWTPKEAKA